MNELEKQISDYIGNRKKFKIQPEQIINLLSKTKKELTIHSDGLIGLANIAKEYRIKLIELSLLRQRRTEEKQNKLGRTPYSKLKKVLKVDDYPLDDINVVKTLQWILTGNPDLKFLEYKGISYFWSIENACHILASQKDMEIVICRLLEILIRMIHKTDEIYEKTIKAEKIGDQNSKNQKKSDQKEQRLEALKLHPKYPELFEAINKYRHTGRGKDKSSINKLLNEITGIENKVTIRCYRNDLIKDFLNSKK
ncbi:MAG: hypothetical protein QG641_3020 [Candidatus Poribacteria bacterium]|nr:hypothetical protein [Euryarchaeota archaeon]MDQ1329728.1 hypothetical protein [Candidatus Poribacteria bacterium]